MSAMAKCPNKGKTNILYNVLYSKKCYFVYFFWAKKNIEQKTFVKKIQGTHNMHNFSHMTIFPKAHGT